MTGIGHREMAAGRWFTLTLAEQLGNVGSEVGRALQWRSREPRISEGAMARALELIDLTLDDPRHRTSVARLREICRAREVLVDFLAGPNRYGSTEITLRRYFDVFAVAAAARRSDPPQPRVASPSMHRPPRLYADTPADAERVLLAIYRRMPAWRKVELVEDANRTARQLALVGLRSRHRGESPARLRRRLLGLVLGEETARKLYGPLGEGE
jgi:hypothetical protein